MILRGTRTSPYCYHFLVCYWQHSCVSDVKLWWNYIWIYFKIEGLNPFYMRVLNILYNCLFMLLWLRCWKIYVVSILYFYNAMRKLKNPGTVQDWLQEQYQAVEDLFNKIFSRPYVLFIAFSCDNPFKEISRRSFT